MGSCLESSVFSTRTVYTERAIHIHKVEAEQVVLNLVGDKVPLHWYCSRFRNVDEWKWGSSWRLPYRKSYYNGRINGCSISRRINQWMDSKNSTILWWINFLVQVRGALILQCLNLVDEDHHWRTDFSELLKSTNHSSVELKVFSSGDFYLFTLATGGNTEMVDRIGKLSSLLKRVNRAKDSWMDLLPLSAMTEQQRENQYQADMTQLNNVRQGRSEGSPGS